MLSKIHALINNVARESVISSNKFYSLLFALTINCSVPGGLYPAILNFQLNFPIIDTKQLQVSFETVCS